LKDFLSDYEYKCISYDKAVIMWDTMRKSVGEQKMVSALRKYYSRCQFKNATAGDLIGSFEKTGLDVGGFFDSFLSGKAIL
jgi:aminopeptidase N